MVGIDPCVGSTDGLVELVHCQVVLVDPLPLDGSVSGMHPEVPLAQSHLGGVGALARAAIEAAHQGAVRVGSLLGAVAGREEDAGGDQDAPAHEGGAAVATLEDGSDGGPLVRVHDLRPAHDAGSRHGHAEAAQLAGGLDHVFAVSGTVGSGGGAGGGAGGPPRDSKEGSCSSHLVHG